MPSSIYEAPAIFHAGRATPLRRSHVVQVRRHCPEHISSPLSHLAIRSNRAGSQATDAMRPVCRTAFNTDSPQPPIIGWPGARLLDEACGGDALVFFAAWNRLLAEGALGPFLQAPIGTVQKPTRRRPVAIVPRTQLTLQLAEGRIVFDFGDDRYWLLPRDMSNRTLLFTMRHGVSHVESKTHRVGCRLANTLDPEGAA